MSSNINNLELDIATENLTNGMFVEASAGTGKTFSIAALIAREVAMNDDVRIAQILVTTFTKNAAAELRDRVRRRLVTLAKELSDSTGNASDAVYVLLHDANDAERQRRIRNLNRAVVEYDTATIATIHSICSKVLALAGEKVGKPGEDQQARVIAEVVNDVLVSEANLLPLLNEAKMRKAVAVAVAEPLTELWCDVDGSDAEQTAHVERVKELIIRCRDLVRERSVDSPSFDDMVRRAREILMSPTSETAVREFRKRYRFIIVDEAQDTDAQQWAIFRSILPMGSDAHTGALVAVGDPKQSIYKFRGADIDAYRSERDLGEVRTLSTNYRSDQPVLDGVNALFESTQFGDGISYVSVSAPDANVQSLISGITPVEIVDVEDATEQVLLTKVSAQRVAQLLNSHITIDGADIRPKDIVVLVKSGGVGRQIENELRRLDIPAVSTGTASVMDSETAEHWRILLKSLERISDAGRTRHILLTPIFGVSATSADLMDDAFIEKTQDMLSTWAGILRRNGIAALVTEVLSDAARVTNLSLGAAGQRRLTDFSHIADLLHVHTLGDGTSPADALEALGQLQHVDSTSEIVSRRVESDSDAVQIMTIHVAKGLEFPVVVVADLWKPEIPMAGSQIPVYRLRTEDSKDIVGRIIDVGWVADVQSPISAQRQLEEACDEHSRLLYVAVTRAKHHVSIMRAPKIAGSIIETRTDTDALAGQSAFVQVVSSANLPTAQQYTPPVRTKDDIAQLDVAPMPDSVQQTYMRTSFTGITTVHAGNVERGGDIVAGGDEGPAMFEHFIGYTDASVSLGVPSMPLARIPGGTYVGKTLHSVYEAIDPGHPSLLEHVSGAVDRFVGGRLRSGHRQSIIDGVVASLSTPFGSVLGANTLTSVGAHNRLAELSFEMSLAHLNAGVTVQQIGQVLNSMITDTDILKPYAQQLSHDSFNIPLAGLINGSIDALLRISTNGNEPRLYITDYKSNRLDRDGDANVIDGYTTERMCAEMMHHHYPLQALIYGAAVHRFLRWRAPHLDPDASIGGIAYFFIRAMVGPDTPVDEHGNVRGVFTWEAPSGLWQRLSDLMAGVTL